MDTLKYLGVIGLVLMVVEYATPIQWVKVHFKVDQGAKLKDNQLIRKLLQGMLNCALCFGFWAGLGFYQDLYWAVIISFSSEIVYRLYSKLTLFI
jgi:hypothetical protein